MMILLEFLRDYNGSFEFKTTTRDFVLFGTKNGKTAYSSFDALHALTCDDPETYYMLPAIMAAKSILD